MRRRDVADELRELLDGKDGRTIEQMIADDPTSEYVVESADYDGEGTIVSFDGGVTTRLAGPQVKVGDTIGLYVGGGSAFGTMRHGWALNGQVVEWKTPWERVAESVGSLAARDRHQREKYAEQAGQLRRGYERLPGPLRERLDRFAAQREDFWVDSGWYELFCCTEAAKFAQAARDAVIAGENAEEVDAFWSLPLGREKGQREPGTVFAEEPDSPEVRWLVWAWGLNSRSCGYDYERQRQVLDLDQGHSNNTFGGACVLARALLEGQPV